MSNQKSLFGFKEMLPKTKSPISIAKILEAQDALNRKDGKGAAQAVQKRIN